LHEVIAGWIGVEMGTFHQISDSLHVYQTDILRLARSDGPSQWLRNSDSLSLPRKESEGCIGAVVAHVDRIVSATEPLERLISETRSSQLPVAFKNIQAILDAEAARRRDDLEAVEGALAICTNACLVSLFGRWLTSRVSARKGPGEGG
jgi:thymidylate synthase